MIIPAIVETNVANKMGTKISVGLAAPICARYTMMLTGIIVSPEVLMTRNIIMLFVAVSFFSFRSCRRSMAFSPKGVAALSSPNIFAEMFIKMFPTTGCPLGTSGNNLQNTGLNHLANTSTTPPFSPIFITPSHRESTPVNPKEISNAVFEVSNVELMIAGNTSVSPMNTSFTTAMAKAMRKKAIQM